ncbi:Zn-dependent hydrolase [Natronobacterium texcoconense]|uniref:N-carbamoyl-L-amino-acid hydrolase n=1 Tax=Natronobacterium texcoconense TaxID=1095778 RepID=A0A1H1ANW4_NATTX|nr:Zn-dependent hydrolase [Natronobacterium texcoconense]SDQ41282.1 N-carbamoyl-L-amino-acid hydrolase [Natronobacterium texcoconense]
MTLVLNRERFVETMKTQADIGGTENGGLHRLALSDEDKAVRDWFSDQMEAAELSVRVDEFGNMFGRREGARDLEPILLGSHLDSQPYGGIYDGALGVVAALEFVRELNDRDIETDRPIEIVNWTNEEGSRFQPTLQGSGVWAGVHDLEEQYAATDEDGVTVEEELERIGYKGSEPAEPATDYDSYLELHIEQGPYLDANDKDVGVVTGIVGLTWGAFTFFGEANHSGATPMHHRSDAMVAAADVVTQIRRIPSTLGERTVGTVGSVEIEPGSINVIPEQATITYGFRDPTVEVLHEAEERVIQEAEAAAEREGIEVEHESRADADPVYFDDRCVDAVRTAASDLEYDAADVFSGGVHDATHAHEVCDAGMVFATSEDGKSHTEDEYTSWDDCYSAANTLAVAALELANDER